MRVKTPHVHAAVIKAWADGATIQVSFDNGASWHDVITFSPNWFSENAYRVKPEPKPDTVKFAHIQLINFGFTPSIISSSEHNWNNKPGTCYTNPVNIKLTFDGETRKLKSVEMIKDECA